MVDSSIGGKTGINHSTGKNVIGSFYQPVGVFADTHFLSTLDKKEIMFTSPEPREGLVFRAGTAETVATISDDTFQLGSSLRIRIDEAHAGQVQPSTAPSTGKQLMIPLSIPAGQSTLVLDYILTGDR